jgi:hypothetical protein
MTNIWGITHGHAPQQDPNAITTRDLLSAGLTAGGMLLGSFAGPGGTVAGGAGGAAAANAIPK